VLGVVDVHVLQVARWTFCSAIGSERHSSTISALNSGVKERHLWASSHALHDRTFFRGKPLMMDVRQSGSGSLGLGTERTRDQLVASSTTSCDLELGYS
jgi:hypothetical protein